MSCSSGGQKANMGLPGVKSRYDQGCVSLWRLLHALPMGIFLHLQSQQHCNSHTILPQPCVLSHILGLLWWHWAHPDNSGKFPYFEVRWIATLIPYNLHFPSTCNPTYSQYPGVRTWTFWRIIILPSRHVAWNSETVQIRARKEMLIFLKDFIYLFVCLFVCLFVWERDGERRDHECGEGQRERDKQTSCWTRSPMWGSIPGPHELSWRQMLNQQSHPGTP